ncbi:SymE family type I addiction module toxin [Leclercia tamurae]|uniref:SymE family type I addiction module toxin n=1 Tax=Leclercia tamurae TaxID=2926467 RepID=UPI0039E5F281
MLKSFYLYASHDLQSPSLYLNGNWLAETGLSTDMPGAVSVEQVRLIEAVKTYVKNESPRLRPGAFLFINVNIHELINFRM